jgi:hypothetical protein
MSKINYILLEFPVPMFKCTVSVVVVVVEIATIAEQQQF